VGDLASEAHVAESVTKALGVSSMRPVVAQVELGFFEAANGGATELPSVPDEATREIFYERADDWQLHTN
jgi:hypothetical protein